jgi:hypothetical protein
MNAVSRRAACFILAFLVLVSTRSVAQAPTPNRGAWESGYHVVRPGDTLEGLAERFLGSSQLWRELHLLNPWVKDPDLLYPGQRLRIFLERPTPEPSAQVVATARKVSELPRPAPWRPAAEGDVLLEKDGLRTESDASARLLFDDGASLTLAEDSLIFIRRQSRASAPTTKKEIEIEVGQADVESAPAADRPGSIEVVVGGARSVGASEAGAPFRTRSRKNETSTAQFMVYEGSSTVSAAGRKVEVPAGSGTSVAPKAPPAPPESLLPAPTGLRPASGGEFDRSDPRLEWQAVPGAASYVVEICRDAACGQVLEAARGITGTAMPPRELLEGDLHWRVTAVAPSGLDGYPSPTQSMVAVESVAPPAPALALVTASGVAPSAGSCIPGLTGVEVRALDRAGTPIAGELLVNGTARTVGDFLASPPAGAIELAARATDARGRSSQSAPLKFGLDPAAPWIEIHPGPGLVEIEEKPRKAKKGAEAPPLMCDSGLEIGTSNSAWQAIPCATAGSTEPLRLALAGDRAQLAFRTSRDGIRVGKLRLGPGEAVRLSAWDVGCGLRGVDTRIVPSTYARGRMMLELTVEDAAGNRRVLGWQLGA